MNFKGLPGMGQNLVPALIVLSLLALMFRTNLRNRFPFETLQDYRRFDFGIPFLFLNG